MCATTLATTTSEKDLGVYVNTELTFEKHIETVVNQASRMLGLILRSYTYLDSQSLLKLYSVLSGRRSGMQLYAAQTPILRRDQILSRECSATSNEADTRATRQRLWGPATPTETTEPILPKSTWRPPADGTICVMTSSLPWRGFLQWCYVFYCDVMCYIVKLCVLVLWSCAFYCEIVCSTVQFCVLLWSVVYSTVQFCEM